MSENEEKALTVKQAAVFLCVTENTINKWRMNKTGPNFSRVGVKRGKILYRLSELVKFLETNETRFAA
ncbi:MAG: hypothetical protein A2X82_20150 [Geobacteraceae bacterium GWC2_55_20]|nr:MAG: hypothetical protein A2X82_20150 [Geobacteraceae bacterium GWC2_55_20]OGU24446.1 MAG: hypothetical protein A2X85_09390 [Geobacteraceae bacterium GWF2_54_21]HCE68393.1 hypothetical protein [Geobacter sp.]